GGGYSGSSSLNTGRRYDPATDTWVATSTVSAPSARTGHTAVWTGTEMIVWGGAGSSIYLNTGGRYDPTTDIWTDTNPLGATARAGHTAVWAGTKMIIWGGGDRFIPFSSGGSRYDPATDTWAGTSPIGVPSARYGHTAIWTGTEMIVWGGTNPSLGGSLNSGGRYALATNTWAATSRVGAPIGRLGHTAVWTGTEMLVWGGSSGTSLDTGGRYCASA